MSLALQNKLSSTVADSRVKETIKVRGSSSAFSTRTLLLTAVWSYFLLVIFEGALRKWFLPGLATPLLVIRDPIAAGAVVLALSRGRLPINGYVITAFVIGCLGFLLAGLVGHGSFFVAAYGARPLWFHIPFAFMMGKLLTRDDIHRIGKAMLWISIPMTVLVFLQFYSTQSAWVNRGVAGDTAGAGFSGALGFMRPPGTFSFTNGLVAFYGFLSTFIAYFWLANEKVNRLLLIAASVCLVFAIPLSISRTLLFQCCICVVFVLATIARKPQHFFNLAAGGIVLGVVFAGLSFTPAFQTAQAAFMARFETANEVEGGIEGVFVDRFLGGMIAAVLNADQVRVFGLGIGLGTQVGAQYTTGEKGFLIAEGEWGRTIGELGPIFGLWLIAMRCLLSLDCAWKSFRRLARGDALAWMLMSYGMIVIAQEGFAQPTNLGFFTVTLGLVLASLKKIRKSE